ncbi:SDR family NAD(P)-dependent oxidoreductase, partial [Streptomyces sp. MCAF7]
MSSPQELFGGGVAVITGAGTGIGAGLARYAARELGMTVVLADVNTPAIAGLRAELEDCGASALDVTCDVRDPDALEQLAERTVTEAGSVRLLVNNAGVEQFGYLWDTPVANWERLVAINVSGVFHGIRAFLPRLMADPGPS